MILWKWWYSNFPLNDPKFGVFSISNPPDCLSRQIMTDFHYCSVILQVVGGIESINYILEMKEFNFSHSATPTLGYFPSRNHPVCLYLQLMSDFQYRNVVLWCVGGTGSIYDNLEMMLYKFPTQRPLPRGLFYFLNPRTVFRCK